MNKNKIEQINKTVIVYQWEQNNSGLKQYSICILTTFYIASYYKNHQYKKNTKVKTEINMF